MLIGTFHEKRGNLLYCALKQQSIAKRYVSFLTMFCGADLNCRPLFATSVLNIIRVLLEQGRQDSMRILGCLSVVDFVSNQVRVW